MYSFRQLWNALRSWGARLAGAEAQPPARPVASGHPAVGRPGQVTPQPAQQPVVAGRVYALYGIEIQDGWNVVDVGAGRGDFTIYAADRTPHGRIYVYEPAAESVDLLRRNLARNDIANVTLFPYAVGCRTREEAASDNPVTVRCVTLADVLADLPDGACDFLRMDCSDTDYDVLLQTPAAVLGRISHLGLEHCSPACCQQLTEFLEGNDWRVCRHPDPLRPGLGFLYAGRLTCHEASKGHVDDRS